MTSSIIILSTLVQFSDKTGWSHYGLCVTHNLFAVFVKGGFNKQCTQSKTQSIVCVPDAGLPARSTRLCTHRRQRDKNIQV